MKIKKLITTIAIGVGLVIPIFNLNHSQAVEAADINTLARQNDYVGVTYLYKMLQTQNIRYNKFYAQGNIIKYRKGTPEGIVIHETATPGASAYNEAIYFNREWRNMYSYVHAFVDSKQVIQMMTPKYGVWGAGAIANSRYIQIELCQENTRSKFAKSVNNDAIYAAKLLRRYQLKPVNACNTGSGTIWSHHAVSRFLGGTNHTDPDDYFAKWGYSMDQFVDLVSYYYNLQAGAADQNSNGNGAKTKPPKTIRTDSTSSTGQKTLQHDAQIYDSQGQLTNAPLKLAGETINVTASKWIAGEKYLQIGADQYVNDDNVTGTVRKLQKNAKVYDTVGFATGEKRRRNQEVSTYGEVVQINGGSYYQIGLGKFIKISAFQ